MPIARLSPEAPSPVEVNLPKPQPEEYKSIVENNVVNNLSALLTYVEGAPWSVQYYSQIVSKHNDLKDFDPTQPNQYQQYSKIKNLEIRVSSPLANSFDNSTGISTVTGSAHLPTCVIPNVGDIFLSTVDQGDDALFRVTMVERKVFNRQSVFYIEYTLFSLVPQHPEHIELLESKVQRTYYYHKDRLIDGLDPLVTPLRHELINKAKQLIQVLTKQYFKSFFNPRYGTIILPGQSTTFYDPLVVKFMLAISDSFMADEIRNMHVLNPDSDPYLAQPTIWTCLLEGNINNFPYINERMGWVTSNAFFRMPIMEGIRYKRMNYIIYPYAPDTSTDIEVDPLPKIALLEELVPTTGTRGMIDLLYNQYITTHATIPLLPLILDNGYYVLSENFYRDTSDKSLLETMTRMYLRGESLDIEKLMLIVKDYDKWSRMEQFYLTPVILILLRTTVGSIYV